MDLFMLLGHIHVLLFVPANLDVLTFTTALSLPKGLALIFDWYFGLCSTKSVV